MAQLLSQKRRYAENVFEMKRTTYILLQWSWGIVQNILGGLLFLLNLRHKHFFYRGAVVTEWQSDYSLGCGMFIFISDERYPHLPAAVGRKLQTDTLVHEYGHTLQSVILGPFFMFVIAVPSVVWAAFFQKWRQRNKVSYYWLYCEKWANVLGDKASGNVRL